MARSSRGRSNKTVSPEPPLTPRSRSVRGRVNKEIVDSSIIDEIIDVPPSHGKKRKNEEDEDDDEYTGDEEDDDSKVKKDSGDEEDVDEEEEEEEEEGAEEEGEGDGEGEGDAGVEVEGESAAVAEGKQKKIPKKRGRKKIKLIFNEDGVLDEDGNPLAVENDEIVIEHEDPKGKAKVEKNGTLIGDRAYRMKTFTILNHGDILFMVSTEPARLVGFRDSYLLFKTHKTLFKKVCTHDEKMDLINRQIIPNSYKGRSVNLVTARSIFREFGAKMIRDGKKVIDDFWEQRAIDRGDVEGEYADPAELYVNKHMTNGLGFSGNNTADGGSGSTPVPNSAALASSALVKYQTDPTWMYQIVVQTTSYNRRLQEDRGLAMRGIKDTYTGLNLYPITTQPTKATATKLQVPAATAEVAARKGEIITDIVYHNPDIARKSTGLKDVPLEIFDDIEDPEIKKAILEQQRFERSL